MTHFTVIGIHACIIYIYIYKAIQLNICALLKTLNVIEISKKYRQTLEMRERAGKGNSKKKTREREISQLRQAFCNGSF